jgi:nucleoside-diphosphate-sugar epimerase
MKILVTGSSGFIGSHLVDRLIEKGEIVKGLDIRKPHRDDYEFLRVDVRNYAAVRRAMEGIKIVYHLAALTSHRLSLKKPHAYTDTNVLGTRNVLEACRKTNVQRLVFTSSSSIYGRPSDDELPLKETSPLRPMGPYAVSKIAAEHYCHFYRRAYGVETVVLRYFNVIGPRAREDICLTIFAKRVLNGLQPIVFGERITRDFTDIRDTVNTTILAMEREEANGQILNIGVGKETKVLDLAWMVIDTLGKGGEIEPLVDERRLSPHEAVRHFADITKAKRVLNWQPRFTAKDAVHEYAKWIKESQSA